MLSKSVSLLLYTEGMKSFTRGAGAGNLLVLLHLEKKLCVSNLGAEYVSVSLYLFYTDYRRNYKFQKFKGGFSGINFQKLIVSVV